MYCLLHKIPVLIILRTLQVQGILNNKGLSLVSVNKIILCPTYAGILMGKINRLALVQNLPIQ